ncbi:MAG: S9 family peptidase [Calothrix sp. SM1_5_4]|nr:S9 family peptidase [Calothrix sp. SM1_5_4]
MAQGRSSVSADGDMSVLSADPFSGLLIVNFQDFLTPPSILAADVSASTPLKRTAPVVLKTLPRRFDAANLRVTQHWATSRDGTKVPYFFVGPKNPRTDGSTPVLIDGYGGFELAQAPYYLGSAR